jgi:hypothetical protein
LHDDFVASCLGASPHDERRYAATGVVSEFGAGPTASSGAAAEATTPRSSPLRVSFHQQYYALGDHFNSVVER